MRCLPPRRARSASERHPLPLRARHRTAPRARRGRDETYRPRARRAAGRMAPYASQRNFGASTLDWCYTAAGLSISMSMAGQKLWDYAAGALILEEAGGRLASLSGSFDIANVWIGRWWPRQPRAVRAVARLAESGRRISPSIGRIKDFSARSLSRRFSLSANLLSQTLLLSALAWLAKARPADG